MGHLNAPSRRKSGRLLAALVISAGLVGAACGGSDSKSDGTTAPSTGGSTDGSTGATDSTVTATTAPPPTTEAVQPQSGGNLVMAVEADTSSPWRPSEMVCAISCYQVIRNIYDSLAMANDKGGWSPYLAEAIEPNADYTEWKITARAGVKFHDGTDFDGAAIVENLSRAKAGVLTGNALRPVTNIAVDPADPMTAVVTMDTPWVAFPFTIAGQAGMEASPTWLAASDSDDTLKSQPVGTGPFMYVDYKAGEVFKMKKNPSYWNAPFPYLDSVEFRPIADALNRRDALKSGTVDIIHSSNGQTISDMRDTKEFPMLEIANNAETAYTLLHVTQTLADGTPSPLTDQRVRCALAYASDEQLLIDTIGAGVNQISFGPFSPTQVGYLEHTGFPEAQDMDKAKELIASYKAEHPGKLSLSLATTTDQTNLTIAQQQQQWWTDAGVDEVTIDQIDQANYIVTALLGNFQVFQWRNHGGFDLDQQYIWWHSKAAPPVGELALNFGRIRDTKLDALLDENRASTDPDRKKAIAEEVNQLFGTECYDLWGSYTIWGIISKPTVHNIVQIPLPDGSNAPFGAGIAGTFYPMTVWVDQ